jgi:hypothetical protein
LIRVLYNTIRITSWQLTCLIWWTCMCFPWGHAMVQLPEALRYTAEGSVFDSRWGHWHYDPGVDSASDRNEYQEYFLGVKGGRCVRLITLPPSCADFLKSWSFNRLEPSEPLCSCTGIAYSLTFTCWNFPAIKKWGFVELDSHLCPLVMIPL